MKAHTFSVFSDIVGCVRTFHPWELSVQSPGLPWEVEWGVHSRQCPHRPWDEPRCAPQCEHRAGKLQGISWCLFLQGCISLHQAHLGSTSCSAASTEEDLHSKPGLILTCKSVFMRCMCVPALGEGMLFPNGHLDTTCLENAGHGSVKVKFFLCGPS